MAPPFSCSNVDWLFSPSGPLSHPRNPLHNVFPSFQDLFPSPPPPPFFLNLIPHFNWSYPPINSWGGGRWTGGHFLRLWEFGNIFTLTISWVRIIFSSVIRAWLSSLYFSFLPGVSNVILTPKSFIHDLFYLQKTLRFLSLFLFSKFMMICHYMGFHYVRYFSWKAIQMAVLQDILL